jgi:hypothetical protein
MTCDVPIEIRRGNDEPAVIWEFTNADGTPADLTGSVFVLEVAWPATSASYLGGARPAGGFTHSSSPDDDSSPGALVIDDPKSGRVAWPFTIAESELIPQNQDPTEPRYALRRTFGGKTRDWAGGPVLVRSYLS